MPEQSTTRVMTITHGEFLRSLRPLERHYRIEINDSRQHIVISGDSGQVQINLGDQYIRKLANLRLPTIEVDLVFTGLGDSELELFWSRFDLCFRRGGG